jgi:hypothetical protein
LLPGAIAVARRAPADPETDALVASQLWLEIRQFPWWRHQKVAGNVLANMRSVLAREGVLKRPSWAERQTVPIDRLPEPIPSAQLSEVVGQRAAMDLPAGGLVTRDSIEPVIVPGHDMSVVVWLCRRRCCLESRYVPVIRCGWWPHRAGDVDHRHEDLLRS